MLSTFLKKFEFDPSHENIIKLIKYFDEGDNDVDDIIQLTSILSNSGSKIQDNEFNDLFVDIASTGGPSSLSTLICPLYLNTHGLNVLKIGVPGRPAGSVDVMSQIKGYNTNLNYEQVLDLIRGGAQYVNLCASDQFVPLDARIFNYRKKIDKIDIPELAIASLLSKKVALNISYVGLDVRVSKYGNFGKNIDEAKYYSKLFIDTAKSFGIKAICFLSDFNTPSQPYIGRGEALFALNELFRGSKNEWLNEHASYCSKMANVISAFTHNHNNNSNTAAIEYYFSHNLKTQGSSYSYFKDFINSYNHGKRIEILSDLSGYVHFNLKEIREYIVKNQKLDLSHIYPDPLGVTLLVREGEFVNKGDPIISIRITHDVFQNLKECKQLYGITDYYKKDYFQELIIK